MNICLFLVSIWSHTVVCCKTDFNFHYICVLGPETFTKASTTLLLGEDSPAIKENRAHGIQALSGTGALRLGAEFLSRKLGRTIVYNSDPTWGKYSSHFLLKTLLKLLFFFRFRKSFQSIFGRRFYIVS